MLDHELVDSLWSLITIQDPLQLSEEELQNSISPQPYLYADKDSTIAAYQHICQSDLTPLQTDLLAFLVDIKGWMMKYRETGELWDTFGDTEQSQLVSIEVNFLRTTRTFRISRFTSSQLLRASRGPMKDWAIAQLVKLQPLPTGTMAIYFTDDDKMKEHGFPFDMTFYDSRKK